MQYVSAYRLFNINIMCNNQRKSNIRQTSKRKIQLVKILFCAEPWYRTGCGVNIAINVEYNMQKYNDMFKKGKYILRFQVFHMY